MIGLRVLETVTVRTPHPPDRIWETIVNVDGEGEPYVMVIDRAPRTDQERALTYPRVDVEWSD